MEGLVPIAAYLPGMLGYNPAVGGCVVIVLTILLFAAGCAALLLARSGYLLTDVGIALVLIPLIHLCAAGTQRSWESVFAISAAFISVYFTTIAAWRNT